MTHAEPAPRPARPATIDGRPFPTVLADSVERFLAAFGTLPASTPEAGPTPPAAPEEA